MHASARQARTSGAASALARPRAVPSARMYGRSSMATGAAGLTLRPLLDGPRRACRVIASFPVATYVEVPGVPEPRVVALVTSGAVRLPNAVLLAGDRTAPGAGAAPLPVVKVGACGSVGGGGLTVAGLHVQVRRWWDPAPVLGPISAARLAAGTDRLQRICADSPRGPGLSGCDGPAELARRCVAGDLPGAVEAAERIVGLGPGLTPSGDDMLAGLLLALRLLGGAIPGGAAPVDRARHAGGPVWLADWLGAAVVADAGGSTTALAATLLHCAARGEAAGEVAAVLHGIAGREPMDAAAYRLLATGHTSGADLAWGLVAGCRAALALAGPAPERPPR